MIEHRNKTPFGPAQRYILLNEAVKQAGIYKPIIFNEIEHLEEPFETNVQRYRYVQGLQLSVPVDIFRFCPGGSIITTMAVCQVPEKRPDYAFLIDGVKMFDSIKTDIKECHTRTQKKLFK